jgi:hypothetical protein
LTVLEANLLDLGKTFWPFWCLFEFTIVEFFSKDRYSMVKKHSQCDPAPAINLLTKHVMQTFSTDHFNANTGRQKMLKEDVVDFLAAYAWSVNSLKISETSLKAAKFKPSFFYLNHEMENLLNSIFLNSSDYVDFVVYFLRLTIQECFSNGMTEKELESLIILLVSKSDNPEWRNLVLFSPEKLAKLLSHCDDLKTEEFLDLLNSYFSKMVKCLCCFIIDKLISFLSFFNFSGRFISA